MTQLLGADELASVRGALYTTLTDRADVITVGQTTSASQPGRRASGETVRLPAEPCSVVTQQIRQAVAGGDTQAVIQTVIRFRAGIDVRTNDRVRVTTADTGEVRTYQVADVTKRGVDLYRVAVVREANSGTV